MDPQLEQHSPPPMVYRYGAYDTTIDEKKRLLVPAECRNSIDPDRDGKAFIVNMGVNRRLWFYPERSYARLVSQTQKKMDITPNQATLDYYQMLFANAYQREPDKQGRLVLPDRLLERADMANVPIEITFVGVMDHYEVWPRALWKARSDELDAKMGQIVETARLIGLT